MEISQKGVTNLFKKITSEPPTPQREEPPKKVLSPEEAEHIKGLRDRIKEAIDLVGTGNFKDARAKIDEASKYSKCGVCSEMLDRAAVDLNYVKDLCNIKDDDCESGIDKIESRLNYMLDDYLPKVE
ncbi:hypothetical protein LCGC14_1023480 [marine sediment metagenome]|uniref:Uncharacterized protein n=1 Tax=marine sediment metagenome TaxID=412755 RepID=A0A0F9MWT9_9ZZZZ